MKNLELSEIRQIFLRHRKWLESQGAEGRKAELEPFHLYGPALCGFDFSQATLVGCQMPLADLRYALMVGTDLESAVLTGIEGYQIGLTGANLRGANLQGAFLVEGIALGASFESCDLRETMLTRADLRRASFVGANLRAADLSEARAQDASFEGADLSDATLVECDLRGARMERCSLARAVLARADLRGADLRRADLSQAQISSALVEGADLRGANLEGTVYERRALLAAKLDEDVRRRLKAGLKHVL